MTGSTKIISIDLDARAYDIYIGAGLVFRAGDFIPQDITGRGVFIIADEAVAAVAGHICNTLKEAEAKVVELKTITAGEQAKSFAMVEQLCAWLLERGLNRNSIIIAVGGGVVGDLAGFCASIIVRGVSYIQVPTTLLAQVDSSVGGKTGINMSQGKNLVGSFYQPAAVIADLDALKTLPERELLAGYAEIVKYGLIRDVVFFEWLEENGQQVLQLNPDMLSYAIEASLKSKAQIVQSDEREQGQRALLNFGHTFGHALETAAGYDGRLLHGEAVAIGICMAYDLSVRMGLCPAEDYDRVEEHFLSHGLPSRAAFIQPALSCDPDFLIDVMRRDKKALSGQMRFVLSQGIGHAFLHDDVPEDLVRAVLKDSLDADDQPEVAEKFKRYKGKWKSAFSSLS